MGIPDHLTCLLKNLNAGQEATVRTLHETTDWFKIGKGTHQGCIFLPCLTYMQNTSCEIWARWITSWNQDCWEKNQPSQICRWYHSNGRKQRGTKEPLDEGERGNWKSWLKIQHSQNLDHDIQSYHFMANRRGESGSNDRFYFFGSKNHYGQWVTAAMKLKDACFWEGKLCQN